MYLKHAPYINDKKYVAAIKQSDGTFKKVKSMINLAPIEYKVLNWDVTGEDDYGDYESFITSDNNVLSIYSHGKRNLLFGSQIKEIPYYINGERKTAYESWINLNPAPGMSGIFWLGNELLLKNIGDELSPYSQCVVETYVNINELNDTHLTDTPYLKTGYWIIEGQNNNKICSINQSNWIPDETEKPIWIHGGSISNYYDYISAIKIYSNYIGTDSEVLDVESNSINL